MKWKLIDTSSSGQKTFAIILGTGEEAVSCLTGFATEQGVGICQFTAIGAFAHAVLGYFDFSVKDYRKIKVDRQSEVLVLAGDISLHGKTQQVHAHVILGGPTGDTKGGHLLEGYVKPTLEIILTESPVHLYRKFDPQSGLALIDLEKP